MADPRALLSVADARALLAIPTGAALPDEATLRAGAARVVERNLALAAELAHLAEDGLLPSPVWEPRGGRVGVRLAVLPPAFRARYFDGAGAEALADPDALDAVVDVLPDLWADPVAAAFALEDTHRAWLDETAPQRSLELAYEGHHRLLSLVLADYARKASVGVDDLEWLDSLGFPVEDALGPGDPSPAAVRASVKAKLSALWAEERAWRRAAFERRPPG